MTEDAQCNSEGQTAAARASRLGDRELLGECRVETFRSGGPGGQHQNTTDSAVRITHEPTGLSAVARESRSQHRNRARALERLREALSEAATEATPRKPTRPTRASRERRLEAKRRRGEKKRLRQPPEE